jgi:outer membrane protein assembly factor BamD (BamD/ComL family)
MRAAQRTCVAVAACWCIALCLALCGCAGHVAATAGGPVYNPWVDASQIPTGETVEPLPTGWERFEPKNIGQTIEVWTGRGPNETVAHQLYAQADELYRKKDYHDAALKYEAAANRFPGTTLAEDATFMAGEGHFFADEYSKADDRYGTVIKQFPNTRFMNMIVYRQFAIGVYWLQYDHVHPGYFLKPNFTDRTIPMFDTFGYAIRAFDEVRLNDPRGKLADEAIWMTANAYFVEHHYDDADYYYKLIRTDYPKSSHQKDAHLLGIQTKLHLYQGPMYDERPLKQAEELIDQTLAQYGRELGDEHDRLMTAKGEIHAQYALRYWSDGQFYEKTKHYGAAKIYYAEIVKKYPQTELAKQSEVRLAAIGPLPDNPPDYFKYLAIVFDGEDPNKQDSLTAGKTPLGDFIGTANSDSNKSDPKNGGRF